MTNETLKEPQIAAEPVPKRADKARRKRGSPFRTAEGCLYNYQENLARLEQLRADLVGLSSRSVTNYDAEGHSVGTHSDPVLRYVQQCEILEREIAGLKRMTEPITRLLADLEGPYVFEGSPKADMAKIARLCYFGKNPREIVISKLALSRRSFFMRKTELVRLLMRYMGI